MKMIKSIVRLVKPAIIKSNGMIRELLNLGTLEIDIFNSKRSMEPKPRSMSMPRLELHEDETEENDPTNSKYVSHEDRIECQLEKPFLMNIHSTAVILSEETSEDLERVNSECLTCSDTDPEIVQMVNRKMGNVSAFVSYQDLLQNKLKKSSYLRMKI